MIKLVKKQYLFYLLPMLWAMFIWGNSLKPAVVSQSMSNPLAIMLQKNLEAVNVQIDESTASFIVRKSAHGTEFALLAVLLVLAFSFSKLNTPRLYGVNVLFIGLMTALTDETIQLFVKGRGGAIRDVWVDFCGVIIGTLIMMLIIFICKKRKLNKAVKK